MTLPHSRPLGIILVVCFFVFDAFAAGISLLMLLLPGTPLDVLWRLNPSALQGFLAVGRWALVLMFAVGLACAAAAFGLWRCRRWGYWTAIIILSINLTGDAANVLLTQDWRVLIGVPIAGLMIAYLLKQKSALH